MSTRNSGSGIPLRAELWRKALHLLSLLIPAGLLWLGRETALAVLVPMTLAAIVVEIARARSATARKWVARIFGFMMRPSEIPPVPAPIHFNGATWVLVSSALVTAGFSPPVAAAAIAIGLVGDAAAAIVGRTVGRVHLGSSPKTLEGTGAFVLSTLAIVWIVPDISAIAGLAGVAAAAAIEAISIPINDNLAVPVVAAIVMTVLMP